MATASGSLVASSPHIETAEDEDVLEEPDTTILPLGTRDRLDRPRHRRSA